MLVDCILLGYRERVRIIRVSTATWTPLSTGVFMFFISPLTPDAGGRRWEMRDNKRRT